MARFAGKFEMEGEMKVMKLLEGPSDMVVEDQPINLNLYS
jgi:hypothetical protein